MNNRDLVIKHAVSAAHSGSVGVANALSDYLLNPTEEAEFSLRNNLVAQAEGFERSARDGSTFTARVKACKQALAAWDSK